MLSNNAYNLMMQMTVEHLSLWRIKNQYLKDSKSSPSSKRFWQKMILEKEKVIHDLKHLIKENLK